MTAIWHPFTQHALMPEQIPVERTEGAYLYTPDGRRIIDAISSWWVNVHGHNHPKIVEAIKTEAGRLDQVHADSLKAIFAETFRIGDFA